MSDTLPRIMAEPRYVQTRERAEELAKRIRGYWAELGAEPDVFIEQIGFGRYPEFAVRSTLKLSASPGVR